MSIRTSYILFAVALGTLGSLSPVAAQGQFGVPGQPTQRTEIKDGIAAVVNDSVITDSQVRELVGARARALQGLYSGAELREKVEEARQGALKDLIDRELILQEFGKLKEERGATIPSYAVDDRVNQIIREEFGGDRAAFIRTLKAQGYTLSQFREVETKTIIVSAMRQQYMSDKFVVSPKMIQAFYNKNKGSFTTPEQIKLRMIVLRDDDSGIDKAAMANEIRNKLATGADFDRMAIMYSEDPNTQDLGGDWGWIDRNTLNQELTEKAFALRAGEVGEVVKIGDSYYIMQVEARKNASVKPINEVRDEIERRVIQEERAAAQNRWLDRLRAESYIKIY